MSVLKSESKKDDFDWNVLAIRLTGLVVNCRWSNGLSVCHQKIRMLEYPITYLVTTPDPDGTYPIPGFRFMVVDYPLPCNGT